MIRNHQLSQQHKQKQNRRPYEANFEDFQPQQKSNSFGQPFIDTNNNYNQKAQTQMQQQTVQYDEESTPIAIDVQNSQAQKRKKMMMERAGIGRPNNNNKEIPQHNKWGKMLVIHDGDISITLGPDYWCFIPTFICFCGVAFGTIFLVLTNVQSYVGISVGFFVCLGECLSYLLVATSNPGVIFSEPVLQQVVPHHQLGSENPTNPRKYCRKCHFYVSKGAYHCRDCDVCIQGYDHHCPWTSKCIGQNNLCRFYIFLLMTPIFMVYVCVVFVMCMSQQVQQIGRPHITTHNIHNF